MLVKARVITANNDLLQGVAKSFVEHSRDLTGVNIITGRDFVEITGFGDINKAFLIASVAMHFDEYSFMISTKEVWKNVEEKEKT